jgi:hypothetical protein
LTQMYLRVLAFFSVSQVALSYSEIMARFFSRKKSTPAASLAKE